MAQAFRSVSSLGNQNVSSFVINAPAGVQNGDLLVMAALFAGTVGFNTLAGWTKLQDQPATASNQYQLFTKVAAGEPANYTWTNPGGATPTCAAIAAISGAGAVIDGQTFRSNGSAGTTIIADAITTTKVNEFLLWIAVRPSIGTVGNITIPTNQIARSGNVNVSSGTTSAQLNLAGEIFPTPGLTTGAWHTGGFSGAQSSRSYVSLLAFLDAVPAGAAPLLFCEA